MLFITVKLMAVKRKQFFISVNVGFDTDGMTASEINHAFQDIGKWLKEASSDLKHIPFYLKDKESGDTIEYSSKNFVKVINRKSKLVKK